MKTVAGALLLVVAVAANAQTFRQVEPNGQVRYDKPGLTERGKRLYQVDPNGRVRYDKPGFTERGKRLYQVDSNGRVRYDKPALQLDADEGGKPAASD